MRLKLTFDQPHRAGDVFNDHCEHVRQQVRLNLIFDRRFQLTGLGDIDKN